MSGAARWQRAIARTRWRRDSGVIALAASLAWPVLAATDPERGKQLYEACLPCHGTELYVPPRRKVQSLAALRKEVERWNRSYNPKLTKAEIDDLVAYLNRDFYQFPVK